MSNEHEDIEQLRARLATAEGLLRRCPGHLDETCDLGAAAVAADIRAFLRPAPTAASPAARDSSQALWDAVKLDPGALQVLAGAPPGMMCCSDGYKAGSRELCPRHGVASAPTPPAAPTTGEEPGALARRFHETYERLAPSFGYRTRAESAVPWDEVPEANRRLMVATVTEVFGATGEARGVCGTCKGEQWVPSPDPAKDNPVPCPKCGGT